MPAVASLGVDSSMATVAEAHQISLRIRAALSQGKNMVDYLGGRVSPHFEAFLTQRVNRSIPSANLPPLAIISLDSFWVALVMIVMLGFLLGMFIAKSSLAQPGAARVGAGALGLPGH